MQGTPHRRRVRVDRAAAGAAAELQALLEIRLRGVPGHGEELHLEAMELASTPRLFHHFHCFSLGLARCFMALGLVFIRFRCEALGSEGL